MRLINLFRKSLILSVVLFLILPVTSGHAAKGLLPKRPFSIELPKDWIELSLPFKDVVASYGRKGTLATFHITARDIDDVKDVAFLKWEDLFSPQFQSIEIHSQGETMLDGVKAKNCLYTLRPGEFKATMEGKLAAKYINYVLIRNGKLYSITFKDTEDGFALDYPSFLAAIRTFHFNASTPLSLRRKA